MAVKLKSRLNGNAQNGENNNIKILLIRHIFWLNDFFLNLIVLPILWQDSSELLLKFEVGGRNKKIEGGQGG